MGHCYHAMKLSLKAVGLLVGYILGVVLVLSIAHYLKYL